MNHVKGRTELCMFVGRKMNLRMEWKRKVCNTARIKEKITMHQHTSLLACTQSHDHNSSFVFLFSCSGNRISRMRRKSCTNENSDKIFPFSPKFSVALWSTNEAGISRFTKYLREEKCWTNDCSN